MKISKYFKLIFLTNIIILLLSIFILSGCNKIDSSNTTPTLIPTKNLEPSLLIKPTVVNSTPSPFLDSLEDTDDNMTEEGNNEDTDNDLCSKDEAVLLSFKIANSDKTASICISKQKSEYIIYRYGKPNNIELEYPDKTETSWDKFTYSYYIRGGGIDNEGIDINYLNFKNGEFNYEIFEEYYSESDETMVGITVTNLNTGDQTVIQGDSNSIIGSLIGLRDNDKIKIIMQ